MFYITREEEKRDIKVKNIKKQSQDRSRKFIDRDATCWIAKEKKLFKKWKKKKTKSIVFYSFLSRNCYVFSTLNDTIANYQSD